MRKVDKHNIMNSLTKKAVSEAIVFLDEEKRKVLELKYGIGGKPKYTNAKLGKLIGKSSRQVDNIEKKAIRKLRRPDIAKSLLEALAFEDDFIWKAISKGGFESGRMVFKAESFEPLFNDALPGEIIVLLRCIYNRVESWLPCNSSEAPTAWIRSEYGDEVLEKLKGFSDMIEKARPPVLVGHFMKKLGIDLDFYKFILALHDRNLVIHGEYTVEQPFSSEVLRFIRIHMLFSNKFKAEIMTLDRIIEEYNSIYEDDHLIAETARASLIDRPHIFKYSGDGHWSANEDSLKNKIMMQVNDSVCELSVRKPDSFFERPWSEMTATDIIKDIIQEKKLCHQSDIVTHFLERTNGRYTKDSVSPVLSTSKEFILLAPSVFGWAESFPNIDLVFAEPDALLTSKDCLKYVLERYAGEPMDAYPLWTPAMERKWCVWAENYADSKLYQSLLYVAAPDLWPVPDAEKKKWKEQKRWNGGYYFESPITHRDWEKITPLQDLFVVANQVKAHGCINWIRINRILNQRLRHQGAAPILLGLITLDVILPAGHWQQMHAIGPGIDEFLRRSVDEIKAKGFLHWDDEAGLNFRDYIRKQQNEINLGWVSREDHKIMADLVKPGLIRLNIFDCKAMEENKRKHPEMMTGKYPKFKSPEQLSLF